jgi:DNA-binding transcriptional LysR family regulator
MRIKHLRTLLAIHDTGSFTAAARRINLSHSAISIQMKQLEYELAAPLFEKGRRPAKLTPLGEEVADRAREIVRSLDELKLLHDVDDTSGSITLGFVPTTLQKLLPVVLEVLRAEFPGLQVSVRSGLSNALAKSVGDGDIDFAFLSAPLAKLPPIRLYEIGVEKLFLIVAKNDTGRPGEADVLRRNPYIAFARSTWLGGQIENHLNQLGLKIDPAIELDSIDAIENLVARGFGASIVPQRLLAAPLEQNLRCLPLSEPAPVRRLMLAAPALCRRQTLLACLTGVGGQ